MSTSLCRPLLIGITGNIGTGKSTVARMLADEGDEYIPYTRAELGVEVIDADQVAHEVMRVGTSVHAQVVEVFGPQVVGLGGEIDRKRLGSIVFADPQKLTRLESIVHPATLEAISRRIAGTSACVVVIEAIKLIEAGLASACDSVWVTTCQPRQQVYRIMGGRGLSRAEALARVQAQPPQEDKIARADVVIDTSGSLSHTRAQVRAAWERLMGGAHAQESERGCSAPD